MVDVLGQEVELAEYQTFSARPYHELFENERRLQRDLAMAHEVQQPRLDGRFVAMAYAVWDSWTNRLALASAGFPPPLLARNDRTERLPVEGVPLGLLPDGHYDEKTLALSVKRYRAQCSRWRL